MGASDWRAGHMGHAAETIKRVARYLTVLVEVADARAPLVTRYDNLAQWIGNCSVLLALNKADLADPAVTERWMAYFAARSVPAVFVQATNQQETKKVLAALQTFVDPTTRQAKRAAVIGLPNLGKSTLLNHLAGRNRTRTGNRPGVTRGPQWVREAGWEWLDLPGVVSRGQGHDWRLKALGTVGWGPEEAEDLASKVLEAAGIGHPGQGVDMLQQWGQAHHLLKAGGAIDRQRTADAVITAFQSGRLGRVSLEYPPDA